MSTSTVPRYCCCCYCNNSKRNSLYPFSRFTTSSPFVPFTSSFVLFAFQSVPFPSMPLFLSIYINMHTHIIIYTYYFWNHVRVNWRLASFYPWSFWCIFLKNKDVVLWGKHNYQNDFHCFLLPSCLHFMGSELCLVTECQMALSHQLLLLEKSIISRMKLHGQWQISLCCPYKQGRHVTTTHWWPGRCNLHWPPASFCTFWGWGSVVYDIITLDMPWGLLCSRVYVCLTSWISHRLSHPYWAISTAHFRISWKSKRHFKSSMSQLTFMIFPPVPNLVLPQHFLSWGTVPCYPRRCVGIRSWYLVSLTPPNLHMPSIIAFCQFFPPSLLISAVITLTLVCPTISRLSYSNNLWTGFHPSTLFSTLQLKKCLKHKSDHVFLLLRTHKWFLISVWTNANILSTRGLTSADFWYALTSPSWPHGFFSWLAVLSPTTGPLYMLFFLLGRCLIPPL